MKNFQGENLTSKEKLCHQPDKEVLKTETQYKEIQEKDNRSRFFVKNYSKSKIYCLEESEDL